MAAVIKKRNDLSLKMKYEVIKTVEREPKIGTRRLAELFQCGKTQICRIIKDKEQIRHLYEANASDKLCQSRKRVRISEYSDINDALYQWYELATKRNLFPDGSLLAEKAKEIAEHLGHSDFKASNGWLHRWKTRHNIKQKKISGESGDVSTVTEESWKERLPQILEGYQAENIWNMDETGCFWRALPDKGLAKMKKDCKGGKKSKHRVTIAFFVNAAGKSESLPIVIWRSANPRCFRSINKGSLPVHYYSQSKSWMTGEIMHSILKSLNMKLRANGRSVILFIDNAGCHPTDVTDKYTNIKVVFLPPNTTSKLQPLDLGIIMSFKTHYRKALMRYILAKMEGSTASEIVKSITVLDAIRWIAQAWKNVGEITIKKCFRKAGILNQNFEVVSRRGNSSEDPFLDLDEAEDTQEDGEIADLISQLHVEEACTSQDLLLADDDIPLCSEIDNERWEEDFFAELVDGPPPKSANLKVDLDACAVSSDDEVEESAVQVPKIKTLSEAIQQLEDVKIYLDHRGYSNEATETMSLIDKLSNVHYVTQRQSTLTEFFPTCN